MDFKIKITCHKCKCSFEIRSATFAVRDVISCPNCRKPLPAQISERLITAISALSEIPETYPENSNIFDSNIEYSLSMEETDSFSC